MRVRSLSKGEILIVEQNSVSSKHSVFREIFYLKERLNSIYFIQDSLLDRQQVSDIDSLFINGES